MSTEAYTVTLARDADVIRRYLYDHSEVIAEAPSIRDGLTVVTIKTTSDRTESDTIWLANYQKGRLESGVYPVLGPFLAQDTTAAAAYEARWL